MSDALPNVIGQTIGEAIAGGISGNGGGADGESIFDAIGDGLSAVGDFLGFDGDFGYDGVHGPDGNGRNLSLGGLGDALEGVFGGAETQVGSAGMTMSGAALGGASPLGSTMLMSPERQRDLLRQYAALGDDSGGLLHEIQSHSGDGPAHVQEGGRGREQPEDASDGGNFWEGVFGEGRENVLQAWRNGRERDPTDRNFSVHGGVIVPDYAEDGIRTVGGIAQMEVGAVGRGSEIVQEGMGIASSAGAPRAIARYSVSRVLGGSVDDFIVANTRRLNHKLGSLQGRPGRFPWGSGREGTTRAIQAVRETLENPSRVSSPFRTRSGHTVTDVYSRATGMTVRVRSDRTFDTIIPGQTGRGG